MISYILTEDLIKIFSHRDCISIKSIVFSHIIAHPIQAQIDYGARCETVSFSYTPYDSYDAANYVAELKRVLLASWGMTEDIFGKIRVFGLSDHGTSFYDGRG